MKDKLYRVYRTIFVVRIGRSETRLVDKLFSGIELSPKPRKQSRGCLQEGVLSPSIVYFHLSWKRSINI
jgi:hypothetical protein